jgi:hypothetical protein
MKNKTCKCGNSIAKPRNSTIWPKKCPSCTYKDLLSKKNQTKAIKEPKKRKPRTHWKDKPTKDMINHVQSSIVNPYIRERDQVNFGVSISDNGPISDAGHYFSRGAKPGMRFNIQNIHGQSRSGNSFKGGDQINYRSGLVERFGIEYVEELEFMAKVSAGVKSLDRLNVILIAETYKYLHANKIWVFTQSEFEKYRDKIICKQ